ncbi:PLDc N-terminal domain-containing protein [Pontibacter ruber]|uniref:PLDc N-terminal domain-containing protein n=1 Tax=Pontibacter ruber TaxID=1343895 RepID=A0ABW5D4M9_9BACT|nr:PLDc N-terminal domain-containing protein [Pontibacter ruber]
MNILLFIGGIGVAELLLILLFLGIPTILWLWALIDLLNSDFEKGIDKLIWLVVIVFIPLLGALLYLLFGRKQKARSLNP